MSNVRVKLNSDGVKALLGSVQVQAYVERLANRIARAAGEGMVMEPDRGRLRARAVVVTETAEAKLAEAHGRALTRAIDAGRD